MAESATIESPQHYPVRSPHSLANVQTVAQARTELEARLAGIHNDLQLTQTIGLLFVKRQEDLKTCFDQIQQLDALQASEATTQEASGAGYTEGRTTPPPPQPLPEALREQLVLLEKEFQEGQNGIVGLKSLIDAQLPSTEVVQDASPRSGSLGPSVLPATTLPAQVISKPRRHKVNVNSVASVNDAAFPVQIQEELLNQVRYWTSQAEMKEKLNQEYDTKINEQERIIDALNKQRRLREESEERQKEEQWNLELQNQELRNQNSELQAQLSKTTHENTKVQKAFAAASEQVEQLKDKEEKAAAQLELVKSRHEQDMVAMRKHNAGVQREKSDLLKKVEDLNATMVAQQQKLSKKATLEALALAQELEEREKDDSVADAPILIQAPARIVVTDETTPATAPAVASPASEPKVASLARETSFAHQQSIISELQSKLSKEITEKEEILAAKEELAAEKEELVKLLADREETIETMRLEGSLNFEPAPVSSKGSLPHYGNSRQPSDLGTLDDAEGLDPDFDMRASDEDSHSFGNGRSSPFPTGGLFAELAQATSVADIKPSTEYKDQEVMTEPIESWIHTVPGFQAAQQVAPVEERSIEPIVKEPSTEPSVEETSIEPIVKETSSEAIVDEAEHKSASVSGKPGTETAAIKALESTAVLTAVESLAIAAPADEIDDDESASRTTKSDAATEERRHTCDMSQATIPDTPTPPVPAIPKEIAPTNAALEGRDYRVSFGSAFGNRNGAATDTGRIRSIYHESTNGALEEHAEDTGEANDRKHTHTLETGTNVQDVTDKATHKATLEASMPVAQTETASRKEEVRADTSIQAVETQTKPLSVSTTRERPSESDATGQTQSPYSPSEASPVAILPSTANGVSGTITAVPIATAAVATGAAIVTGASRTAYTYGQNSSQVHVPGASSSQLNNSRYQHITDSSGASIGRSKYRPSLNGSISSMSTDYHNGRRGSIGSNYDVTSTDPTMIQVITQTMIGDYLWKYTRRPMGNAISEKRHRRYFWVHPYTKTMYWSLNNPGAEGSREQRAKSAFILAVFQVTDENPNSQSDLPNVSLLVQTTSRNLKLTAPTREKHELWYQSLAYLLSRPTTPGADIASDNQTWSEVQASRGATTTPGNDAVLILRNNDQSIRKKGSMNRLHNMFGRKDGNNTNGAAPLAPPRISALASRSSLNIVQTHHHDESVVAYPTHMSQQTTVGGNGLVKGGSILAAANAQTKLSS
ncbi:hypothetical protein BGZ59_003918 [Podila verticillata]|nr:hypothetical protein BGZ59_003918 [Podila verticillata]KFH73593.1 hypothetical protein MVEG_00808 [Podila verticillata NRRL 6337]